MSKTRLTSSELDARLKFMLGTILGLILLCTSVGILYGLLFVTQPIGAQSENDKMFFNVLGSIATFITGTLAGILIGKSGSDEIKSMGTDPIAFTPEPAPIAPAPVDPAPAGKPEGQVPEEQPVDEDWDKE